MKLTHINKHDLSRLATAIFIMVLVALVALVALSITYSQTIPLNWDEGAYLMAGSLAVQGYEPYAEFFVNIPPFGLKIIQFGVMIFGDGLGVRYIMVLCSLIGAGSMLWLVKNQASHRPIWTGLLAALFLMGYPNYFFQSPLITMDVPAVSFALLAIALVEFRRFRPSSGWLLLSGLSYGLSLASKLIVPFLPAIIALQFLEIALVKNGFSLSHRSTYIDLLKMGLIWLVGPCLVLLLSLLIYDPTAMYQQVIAFHLADRAARVTDDGAWIQKNANMLLEALGIYLPVVVGALVGLLAVGRRGLSRVWIWPVWLVLAALFLFLHVPLRTHHLVILMPPLAALSSVAVTHLPYRFNPPVNWLAPVTMLVLLGLILLNLLRGAISFPEVSDFDNGTGRRSTVEFVQQTTGPNDCIVVDDARAALYARRPIPPNLSEPSHSRINAGLLSTPEVIETANKYDCPVLIMGPRFSDLPGFEQAAQAAYSLKMLFANSDGSHTITVFAVKLNSNTEPAQTLNHSFGQLVLLKGIDLTPNPWQLAQTISLSTYWQARQQLERDYKIFLHLKDTQGNIVYSFDHFPFESSKAYLITHILPHSAYREGHVIEDFRDYPSSGLLPTRLWIPGHTLKETVNLTLPTDFSPGTYTVEIGMYDPITMEQLGIQDNGDTPGVVVATVEVTGNK